MLQHLERYKKNLDGTLASQELTTDQCESRDVADMVVRLAEAACAEHCAGNPVSCREMLHDPWRIKKRLINGISDAVVDTVS